MRRRFFRTILLCSMILASSLRADGSRAEELRIDGFESGQEALLQLGLAPGDILAVRLVPTVPCPCQITDVRFLLGTPPEIVALAGELTGEYDIHVWDDPGGDREPGTSLFTGPISQISSGNQFISIDTEPEDVIVNGPFRVGLELIIPALPPPAAALPSLFRDSDGTLTPFQNFTFDSADDSWKFNEDVAIENGATPGSEAEVLTDWIIRAVVEPVPATPVPTLFDSARAAVILCLLMTGMVGWRWLRPRRAEV